VADARNTEVWFGVEVAIASVAFLLRRAAANDRRAV
jgi:hypothetical protein